MDKQQLRKAIVSLATGQVKRGVLVLLTHDCPPDHYRTGMNGEKLITAAEAEQLASEAEIVITFNRPTNDKLQKSEGPV